MIKENLLIEYKPGYFRELTKEEWFCYYYVKMNEIYNEINWYDLPVVGDPTNENGPEYLHDAHYTKLCFDWFKNVNIVMGNSKDVKITSEIENSTKNIETALESIRNFSTYLEMISKNLVEQMESQKRRGYK